LPRSAGIPDSLATWTAARRVAFARFASLRSFDDYVKRAKPVGFLLAN
jgi:glycerol dehydrogenase-like iron-containing ADH family enzyme